MGDNGYFYGEHGLSEERRLAYEESIRLPLLVRYPKLVRAGSTPEAMSLMIDLAPTIADLAGAPPMEAIDGRSLVPLFKNTPSDWRRSFPIEYTTDIVFPRIRYRDLQGMNEMYDLKQDPFELHNLIGDPSTDALRKRLEAELNGFLATP